MANKKPCDLHMGNLTQRFHSLGGAKYAFEQAVKAGWATEATIRLVGARQNSHHLSVGARGAIVVTKVKP